MKYTVTYEMLPVANTLRRLGLGKDGDVQKQLTNIVNKRITRYMPYRTGALSGKLKRVIGTTQIQVLGPYARYQYYGKAMEGRAPKVVTERDLNYDKTKNPLAGPYWDRRLIAAEGKAIVSDLQRYVDRRNGGGK